MTKIDTTDQTVLFVVMTVLDALCNSWDEPSVNLRICQIIHMNIVPIENNALCFGRRFQRLTSPEVAMVDKLPLPIKYSHVSALNGVGANRTFTHTYPIIWPYN